MRPALLFFLQFWANAAPGRFASVFFSGYGLSDAQVGGVLAAPVVLSLATATPAGALADRWRRGAPRLLLYANGVSALFFQALGLLPLRTPAQRCAAAAVLFSAFRLLRAPTNAVLDAYTLRWLSRGGRGGAGVAPPPESPDADKADAGKADADEAAADHAAAENRKKYGEERLWGAVSYGVCSLSVGVLIDHAGLASVYPYNAAIAFAFVIIVYALDTGEPPNDGYASLQNPSPESDAEAGLSDRNSDDGTDNATAAFTGDTGLSPEKDAGADAPVGQDQTATRLVLSLLCDPRTLIFLITVASVSVGTALVENLVFLYFVNDLKASYSLCGLSIVTTVVFEIPLFYYSELMYSLLSRRSMILVAMFSYVTRVVYYTLVDDDHVWWILCAEPLHGVTYSLLQMAAVQEMADLAPPHLQVTAQTLMGASRDFGTIVGTLGGSFVMQHYGSTKAYRMSAALVTAAAFLYGVSSRHRPAANESDLRVECEGGH